MSRKAVASDIMAFKIFSSVEMGIGGGILRRLHWRLTKERTKAESDASLSIAPLKRSSCRAS